MLRPFRLDRSMILLGLILLCAAVVRIGWPGIAEFKYDEAMISRRAIAFAQNGIWPASTISSIPGIPQPPIKALLLAIPYAFTRSPLAAVAFQGLLGTITVALAYVLGAAYFNRRAGLIAAAALALAPWALFYDRKLWSQDVPVITALMMMGLFLFIIRHRRWGLVLAAAGLGLLIGFYLGDAILAGVVVLGLACFPRALFTPQPGENRRGPLLWGAAALVVLAITLSPYAVELGARHASPSAVSQAVSQNTPRPFDPLGQIAMSAQVAAGYDFHALAGDKVPEYYASLPLPDLNAPLDGVAMWVIIASMVYVAVRGIVEALRAWRAAMTEEDSVTLVAPYILLALWLFVPVGAWTIFRQMPYPHRYIMAYPSQALALGVMLSDGWRWADLRWPKFKIIPAALVIGGLAILSIWHGVLWFGMLRFVSATPINGGHGAPVERLWSAAEQARTLSGAERLPVVIHTSGDDPEYQGGAAEFDAVLGDLPIYLIHAPGMEVVPAGSYVWVRDHGNGQYTVEARKGLPPAIDPLVLARQANGIDLLSAARALSPEPPAAGEPETITLAWRVWHDAPLGRNYGFTAQLYGEDGANLGQVDMPFLRSVYWRTGDMVTTRVDISLKDGVKPGGSHRLVVAMYGYLSETQIEPVDILDIAGNPAGQQVTVDLK